MNEIGLTIGGFVPLTTIDFPDHLSAVIFCQGCPYRCIYCHNPDLIKRNSPTNSNYTWNKIESFLVKRRGLLEAVVFSGGEPTLQRGLISAIKIVKELGYKIGLHTAGPYPERLKAILPYVDWVGMDLKAPFDQYDVITRVPRSGERALKSAEILLQSGVPYEFRTTVYPDLIGNKQIKYIARTLRAMGAKRDNFKLQKVRLPSNGVLVT